MTSDKKYARIEHYNNANEKEKMMAYVEYHGIDTRFCDATAFLNSSGFRAILDKNPHLYLLESEYKGIWGEDVTFHEVNPPFPEKYSSNLFIRDTLNDKAMHIIYDDLTEVIDPSPEFIEILKLMDTFSIETLNKRIFTSSQDWKADSQEIMTAEYDFSEGAYKPEESK